MIIDKAHLPASNALNQKTISQFLSTLAPCLPTEGVLGIAFSGGVDSTVLVKAACMIMGTENVLAIVGVSESLAHDELREARELADEIGVRLIEVPTHEAEIPEYKRNWPDRCFHCKNELFAQIEAQLQDRLCLSAVAYGETADDNDRFDRPGAQAADLHNVLRPLASAKLEKNRIREFALAVGLSNWNKPAMPCLASRIPFHSEVTPKKLQQIAKIERVLRDLGFTELRVRHHDQIARIEISESAIHLATREPLRSMIVQAAVEAGFEYAVVDLAGLRSGHFAHLEIV